MPFEAQGKPGYWDRRSASPPTARGEQKADPTNAGEMQKNRRVEFRDGGAARFRKRALRNRGRFRGKEDVRLPARLTGRWCIFPPLAYNPSEMSMEVR